MICLIGYLNLTFPDWLLIWLWPLFAGHPFPVNCLPITLCWPHVSRWPHIVPCCLRQTFKALPMIDHISCIDIGCSYHFIELNAKSLMHYYRMSDSRSREPCEISEESEVNKRWLREGINCGQMTSHQRLVRPVTNQERPYSDSQWDGFLYLYIILFCTLSHVVSLYEHDKMLELHSIKVRLWTVSPSTFIRSYVHPTSRKLY